ncbi:MAG: biotin/lipoyl-containing protein [Symbiobacteriia bacterium]
MKRFRVTVNGQPFEVTVEETGAGAGVTQPVRLPGPPAPPLQMSQAAPRPAAVPTPAASPAPTSPAAGAPGAIAAPLPGVLVAVKVEAGQTVSPGQVLCILEAMKMENDILAPRAGVVREILAAAGTTVAGGQALLIIE